MKNENKNENGNVGGDVDVCYDSRLEPCCGDSADGIVETEAVETETEKDAGTETAETAGKTNSMLHYAKKLVGTVGWAASIIIGFTITIIAWSYTANAVIQVVTATIQQTMGDQGTVRVPVSFLISIGVAGGFVGGSLTLVIQATRFIGRAIRKNAAAILKRSPSKSA